MEAKEKKPIQYYMRALHRDLGFLVIGITIVYVLSGITLIYRNTDFLKKERQIQRELEPNINDSELGMALHIRDFKVVKTEGDIVYFNNGTYNKTTGVVNYSNKALPAFLEKFNKFHKAASGSVTHWLSVVFAVLLLFLAISSFWMFKPKTKMFRRGMIFAGIGLCIAIIFLLI